MRKMKNDAPTVADQSASSMIANNSSSNTIAQTSLQNQGSSNKDNIENIISVCTEAYCSSKTFRLYELSNDEKKICNEIRSELLKSIQTEVMNENAVRKKSQLPVIKHVEKLNGYMAAMIVLSTDEIRMLLDSNGNPDVLIVKDYYWNPNSRSWKWSGIWKVVEDDDKSSVLDQAFRNLCLSGTRSEREIYYGQLKKAPRANAWADNNKVFLRNGLWDYETSSFTEYDDPVYSSKYADLIALEKLPVYHPYGKGAVIAAPYNEPVFQNHDGTVWTPMSQLKTVFNENDSEGQASIKLVIQSMQFLIRHINAAPHVYFFWIDGHGGGHNGKGALWEMMKRLIFKQREFTDYDLSTSDTRIIMLSVDELDDEKKLSQFIRVAYAIVGEETSGSTGYVNALCCKIMKVLARAQAYMFRSIYGHPFSYAPSLFLLQQCNEIPMFAEKNTSVNSHNIYIPFRKTFDDSKSYIKDDYVLREEVAEWWIWYLTTQCECWKEYDDSAIKALNGMRDIVNEKSIHTSQFFSDLMEGSDMKFYPAEFIYDVYLNWCDGNGLKPLPKDKVMHDAEVWANTNAEYPCFFVDKKTNKRTFTQDVFVGDVSTSRYHPILAEYGVDRHGRRLKYAQYKNDVCTGCLNPDAYLVKNNEGNYIGKQTRQGGLERAVDR